MFQRNDVTFLKNLWICSNLYNLQILYKIIKDNISEAFILYYKQFVKKNMSWELTKCVHSYLNVSNRCRYTMQSIFIASNVAAWVKIFAKMAVSLWKYSPLCLKKGSTLTDSQGWEFAQRFSERKNERMSALLKKMSDSLIFGERPERFAQGRSVLVSNLS